MILYNTCSIREKAAQKVFSRLGEYRESKAKARSSACWAAWRSRRANASSRAPPWVSLVCGSASYSKLPEMIAQLEAGNQRVTGLDTDTDETFETEVTRRDNPWRAYLTIIEGCDKAALTASCLTRGARSVAARAMRFCGKSGNSRTWATPRFNFSGRRSILTPIQRQEGCVSRSCCWPSRRSGIRRVRFTTSHPSDFEKGIVEAIESQPKICDHVHLPVQSGSTKVLRAMQRTYSRGEYLEKDRHDARRQPADRHHD